MTFVSTDHRAPAIGESTGRHPAQGNGALVRERPTIAMKAWTVGLVSCVIVTTNRRRDLDAVLRTMSTSSAPSLEIIVVDDGSTDDTWKWLQQSGHKGTVSRNETPVGLVDAATQGINLSVGEYIGVVDLTGTNDPTEALNHTLIPRSYYETIGRYQR